MQAVIAKSNDDVRQEVFIMQLIAFYEVRPPPSPSVANSGVCIHPPYL